MSQTHNLNRTSSRDCHPQQERHEKYYTVNKKRELGTGMNGTVYAVRLSPPTSFCVFPRSHVQLFERERHVLGDRQIRDLLRHQEREQEKCAFTANFIHMFIYTYRCKKTYICVPCSLFQMYL